MKAVAQAKAMAEAASARGALGSWRVGSPTAIANRRNTISPLMGGFRKKKSRLALQGQFLLLLKKSGGEPNVKYRGWAQERTDPEQCSL